MAITEEHFIGFDPTRGAEQLAQCPRYPYGATILWYEKWFFTSWSFGRTSDTGIFYAHTFVVFDMLGNVTTDPTGVHRTSCGFTGNETCIGQQRCPTNDEWLARARAACDKYNLPAPGTIELVQGFSAIVGVRSAA